MPLHWMMAATNIGKAFQDHTRRSGTAGKVGWVALFVLLAVGFFLVMYFWDQIRLRIGGGTSSEKSLFEDLCKLHHLTSSERELLSAAINRESILHPAYAFVDRSVLGRYAKANEAREPCCAALTKKLFDDD